MRVSYMSTTVVGDLGGGTILSRSFLPIMLIRSPSVVKPIRLAAYRDLYDALPSSVYLSIISSGLDSLFLNNRYIMRHNLRITHHNSHRMSGAGRKQVSTHSDLFSVM
ncbi:hypothetical protein BX666DRAFT_797601 [Dichotomocladium elegans]|nr:hypothetical protein BX666DRAFT_797601 [Dichotomocladium elegans]